MFELLYSIQSDSHSAGNVPRRSESHKPAVLVKACRRNRFGFSRGKVVFVNPTYCHAAVAFFVKRGEIAIGWASRLPEVSVDDG